MIKLNFTVTGAPPNIVVTHLDDNGQPRSARPGSPEELLLYQMVICAYDAEDGAAITGQIGVTGSRE